MLHVKQCIFHINKHIIFDNISWIVSVKYVYMFMYKRTNTYNELK